ncbi:hypothetical protein [Methylorubrum sp. SL192]|uniref:hypothetical protein n=1 Tax=Methylorubrum sp. SL192 TaxID=2995167 RepID=UPI002275C4A4|nr:hypothetical protein [Methylorubrum sp. SL192]MCY1643570.1 hypothetical protein [Methylorubrum sp. SL192]
MIGSLNSFGIDVRLPTMFDSPPRPENTGRGGPFRPDCPAPNAAPGKLCRFARPARTLAACPGIPAEAAKTRKTLMKTSEILGSVGRFGSPRNLRFRIFHGRIANG